MSRLKIATRSDINITILDMSGKLTSGHGARILRANLRWLYAHNNLHILLNFTNVTTLDETGMNVVINSGQNSLRADNHVKIFGVDKRSGRMKTDLVTLTRLLTAFDVFDDETSAVSSFAKQDYDVLTHQIIRRNGSFKPFWEPQL